MMGGVPTDWEGGISLRCSASRCYGLFCWKLSCFVMGKTEDDGNLRAGDEAVGDSTERNARCGGCCEWISCFVGCKCFFVLLLSVSLFLSALFLLLPFPMDREDSNLDPRFRGDFPHSIMFPQFGTSWNVNFVLKAMCHEFGDSSFLGTIF